MNAAKLITGCALVLLSSWGRVCVTAVCIQLLSINLLNAQGTLHITFDGPPLVNPGSAIGVQQYFESGMSFVPLGFSFGRVGSSPEGGRPDSGTAYLQAALGQSLAFSMINGSVFDLVSVDLAEYSMLYQTPLTVHFVGYQQDGSIVTADLTTDGIIDGTEPLADFETFQFSPEWSGLTRVEIPTYGWSLDNLYVSIPEPGTWAMLLSGGLVVWVIRYRRIRYRRKE